jgi:dihydrofolate reductase
MFSIIVAVAENNCIGKNNELPWKLSTDLKRFYQITKGHSVIMGRKTFESILKRLGRPLRDRRNIVLTKQRDFTATGVEVFNSLNALSQKLEAGEEHFVIGGAEIYRLFLPKADKIYRTLVHARFPAGDAFFPPLSASDWEKETETFIPKDDKNEFDTTFTIYRRRV